MSEASKAVFLSYASQDAEAARKICDALCAAGVEVWFDQSELRGGDAWDQKIRMQIKECALFVPVISANTQARLEGYFRLEWKLAEDRSHLMAKGKPFIVPVCIDDTKDWDAQVPDAFMSVQWTRLPAGETPPKFCERVKSLLAGEVVARAAQPVGPENTGSKARATPTRPPARPWLLPAIIGAAVIVALAIWQPWRKPTAAPASAAPPAAASPPAAPAVSEGVKLAQRARALYDKVGFTRDDMMLADDFAKRATDGEPTSGFCWGVRAHVQAAFLFRGFAVGDEFVQRSRDAQSFANRALSLQLDEPEALLALGRVATYQRAYTQAEEIFGRALAAHPADNRTRRALGTMLRYQPKRVPEALTVLQEAVQRDPRDALAHYDLSMAYREARDFGAAWQAIEATIALQPFGSAFTQKASLALAWKGDVVAMRAALEQMSPADRAEDRAVYYAMWCGLIERQPARVIAAAALNSRDYLEDSAYSGPKAWFPALALQFAGQENSARLQWQAAERVLRERLRTDPQNAIYRLQLATTLAWMGQAEEAARELAPVEAAWREQLNPFRARSLARYYAALGDAATAVPYLRRTVNDTYFSMPVIRTDQWWDKLRGKPEFEALLAAPPPAPAPIRPAPYRGRAPVAATPAAREAEQLIARVYAMITKVSYTREDLGITENLTRQATELAPESARAWAARARVQASSIQRTWDTSEKRRQDTQAFAVRALAFDPDDADAMIAQAVVTTAQGSPAQSETILRRAVQVRPADPLARRLIATALWQQGRNEDALATALETARLFPDDALAQYDLGNSYTSARRSEPDLAVRAFEAAIAIEPFASALLAKALILTGAKGDFPAARRTLDQLSPTERSEDRAVSFAMWLGLLQRDRNRVEAAAALTARTYFEDTYFFGPKAWMLALALQQDGKEAMARVQWQVAETAVRARLQDKPNEIREKFRLCTTLAWLGRTAEAAADVATVEGVARESNNLFILQHAAQYYAARGDAPKAVPYLRRFLNTRDTQTDRTLALDPWWAKLRGSPEFEALLAEAKARVEAGKK